MIFVIIPVKFIVYNYFRGGGPLLADRISAFLTYLNFIRIKDLLITILSLRVGLGQNLRLAEHFLKNEEIAELNPFEARNLRFCFSFTSNSSASRNDRFFI